jgi:hypothetical protein
VLWSLARVAGLRCVGVELRTVNFAVVVDFSWWTVLGFGQCQGAAITQAGSNNTATAVNNSTAVADGNNNTALATCGRAAVVFGGSGQTVTNHGSSCGK